MDQNTQVSFIFTLNTYPRDCIFQAKPGLYFLFPDCKSYQLGSHYRVIGSHSAGADSRFVQQKMIDVRLIYSLNTKLALLFVRLDSWGRAALVQLDEFRQFLVSSFYQLLGVREATLGLSLILGSRVIALPADIHRDFEILGLLHLVAVSGFHLHLFFSCLSLLLMWLLPRRYLVPLLMLLIAFYTCLTGSPMSALRAGLMLIFSLISSTFFGNYLSGLYSLCLALITLVVVDPACLENVGLILSVLATLAVLLLTLHWPSPAVFSKFFWSLFKADHTNLRLYIIIKLHSSIKGLIFATLLVQLIIMPVQINTFHQISLISFVVAGFLAVLISFFALYLVLLLLLMLIGGWWEWWHGALVRPLAEVARAGLSCLYDLVHVLASNFNWTLRLNWDLPWWLIACYYSSIGLVFLYLWCKKRQVFIYGRN